MLPEKNNFEQLKETEYKETFFHLLERFRLTNILQTKVFDFCSFLKFYFKHIRSFLKLRMPSFYIFKNKMKALFKI